MPAAQAPDNSLAVTSQVMSVDINVSRLVMVHASAHSEITRNLPNLSPRGPNNSWNTPYAIAYMVMVYAALPKDMENSSANIGKIASHARIETRLVKQQLLNSHGIAVSGDLMICQFKKNY